MENKRALTFKEKVLKQIKRQKRKTHLHVFILLPVLVVAVFLMTIIDTRPTAEVDGKQRSLVEGVFVGDIMMGRHVEEFTDRHGAESVFRYVKPYLDQADYVTGNFEQPITEGNREDELDKQIHLHAGPEAVKALDDSGFTVVSLSNNHTMDYGERGLLDTLSAFEGKTVGHAGAGVNRQDAREQIHMEEVNGMTIATLGFTDVYSEDFGATVDSAGVTTFNPDVFVPMVTQASNEADLVVVHAHWGQEYENRPNDRQRMLARALSDAGADIVIGHHPHVLQGMEVYNDTAIFYSLGNFVFDQGWTRTRESALVRYELTPEGRGMFEVVPMYIREASPAPLTATDKLNEISIRRALTKTSNFDWTFTDGSIKFEVDHSEITNEMEDEETDETNEMDEI
ncbi:CapA family protein [Bacillus sp. JCM 19041]|uniref:CapA family protein n=1 Tax=Bacillus sp. JCM 19041 TaxID=1460637 RepID=UPI00336A2C1A